MPTSSCLAREETQSPPFGEPVLDFRSEVTCQLIDFQWKLGMAVSSDGCRLLKYPYVALLLKVADHSGQVNSKSIKMTIPQFQNFYRQFKEIAAVIETVKLIRDSKAMDSTIQKRSTYGSKNIYTMKIAFLGLERWLRGLEHWLLFERAQVQVQFPVFTWQLMDVCNSSTKGFYTLPQTSMQAKHQ
ncbi:unknown_gene_790 [Phodopus roborovskii]|uniref:COMM domain-containing protein 6 n=1 Tax=Phodopus roborovskii TaxID=109678 RepID=A0AAU9ZLX8_PHORO|nr:unknown_gene_790 [Phodopus roborovskii]